MTISIPLDLRKELSDYYMPLRVSERIFNEMQSQEEQGIYKKVQVLPIDPEWRFVWRYFNHDKPNGYEIKRIYCINKIQQQKAFELNLSSIEKEANTFKTAWHQDSCASQRAKAIEQWKQSVNIFSPFYTTKTDGKIRNWQNVKILPLWHISSKIVRDFLCESGFLYFEKTTLEGEKLQNADDFSENGIYFTNSARYAFDDYNERYLFLTWVSMREPFPFVGDPTADMETLRSKDAYKGYNACYVPITLSNPSDAEIYDPTKVPNCDEIVVFQKSQTLPSFLVELEVEKPCILSDNPQTVNELISHIIQPLQNLNVDRDQRLRKFLCDELKLLFNLRGDDYLEERHKVFYNTLKQIL